MSAGSAFLGALADQISSQFSLGENLNHSLDSVDPLTGKQEKYGSLGDFAQNFDQSAERRYVEEGYLRKDPYNTDPKQFEVLMQEPNATVLIKKKMFSSVGDNFRPDFMDKDEVLYYKAMRILFANKCAQIAALEKLSKIQKITSSMGKVDDQLIPLILSTSDDFNASLGSGSNLFGALGGVANPMAKSADQLNQAVDKMRRFYAFNVTSPVTKWITDSNNLFQSQYGQGTGVIEITNFTSFTTNVTTETSGGGFTLSIVDPYESMLITEFDIEKALSDATNMFYQSKVFQFAKQTSDTLINDLQVRLNQLRNKRGAGSITFKIDPETLLGRRVTAIIDRMGIDIPFTYDSSSVEALFSGGAFGGGASIPDEYLKGGSIAGFEGLDPQRITFGGIKSLGIGKHTGPDSEVSIFNRLVSTIYSKISQDANSQNSFQTHNKNTNYARKKLRFNFSGKLIIQPMDVVHIYVNSKSRYDTKLLSGLQNMFSGLGMLQNLNNTLTGIKNAVNTIFNPSGSVPIQAEKAAFVGPEFPNYLWAMMRSNFVTENEGTHVFAGVVDIATDNWSDGKFTVDVNGKDNTVYFEQGKINFKPGVDVFNGAIFDPLTPFQTNFNTISSSAKDETPTLLIENQSLLGLSDNVGNFTRKSLIKHKLGRFAGELVNEKSMFQDRSVDPVTGRTTKVFYAPDGLVYKWKEGIGIFTQFGSNLEMNDVNKVGNPNIAKEPFAGQDVMNVLSLLVTGQPYNFATYFKAVQQFDSFGKDPQDQQSSAHSFALSLRNDLSKSNTLWGNFIPFKNLVIDEASYALAISTQTSIIEKNQVMESQIKQLQDLNQKAIIFGAVNALADQPNKPLGDIGNTEFPQVQNQILKLKEQITNTQNQIQKENDAFKAATNRDISFEATDYIDPAKTGSKDKGASAQRRMLRRQLNYLTRRMSYNVRANEDKNLFIVDDFYDKDMDVIAYNQALTDGIALYNNEFTSVKEKIGQVAQLLNLEVFADTQGHIRCRPPQYNRMPSSVFYRMMYLKQTLNVQVFPEFLDDLFNTKLDALRSRIEIIEDQIRLDFAILNTNTDLTELGPIFDYDARKFIQTNGPPEGAFGFISDPNTGTIVDIPQLMKAANPDQAKGVSSQALEEFNNIKSTATSTKEQFSNYQKYLSIIDSLTEQALTNAGNPINATDVTALQNNVIVDKLITRIQTKSAQRIDKNDYIIKDVAGNYGLAIPTKIGVDVFKVVSEISEKISERQKLIRLFYNTIKNAQEFKSLDENGEATANKLLLPGSFGKSETPEVFEHMIEDESYDDYGPGSGTRYVIKRPQIRSISIAENPPPWTMIEVQGVLNSFAPDAVPPGLNSFPGGGNGMVTALAVDYDMWRNYGFKSTPPLAVPFLSDPATQCGPYANMLLSRNRKNILKGSVTISGNEFMQPGEVVFLEDRQLLFYVSSVKHNFTFGSQFTTTLELTYGHTPGEYIPTVMDMIGKMIYNNKDSADLVVQRQDTSANEINLGVIQLAPNTQSYNPLKSLGFADKPTAPPSTWGAANAQVINNILYTAAYQVNAHQSKGDPIKVSIELRTYHDDTNQTGGDLWSLAQDVRNLLVGSNNSVLNSVTVTKQGIQPPTLPSNSVKFISDTSINLDDAKDRRSPSQKALAAARAQLNSGRGMSDGGANSLGGAVSNLGSALANVGNTNTGNGDTSKIDNDKLRTCLFKYVIDCWLIIEPNSENVTDPRLQTTR